jgi:hypothetical protein
MTRQNRSSWCEQVDDANDEFKYLLPGFIPVDLSGLYPKSADRDQRFEGILDLLVNSNLLGGQVEPSEVSLGSRLIISADRICQALEQDAEQKPLAAVVCHSLIRATSASRCDDLTHRVHKRCAAPDKRSILPRDVPWHLQINVTPATVPIRARPLRGS